MMVHYSPRDRGYFVTTGRKKPSAIYLSWWGVLRWQCVPLIALCLWLSGCDNDSSPPIVKRGEIPICKKTGKTYTAQQLIDIAVSELIRRELDIAHPCRMKYSSLKEFYKINPHCCDIDIGHSFMGEPTNNLDLGGIGYLVGGVRMYHYCNASTRDFGEYAMGLVDITSCGVLMELAILPYDSKFVGHYPRGER